MDIVRITPPEATVPIPRYCVNLASVHSFDDGISTLRRYIHLMGVYRTDIGLFV